MDWLRPLHVVVLAGTPELGLGGALSGSGLIRALSLPAVAQKIGVPRGTPLKGALRHFEKGRPEHKPALQIVEPEGCSSATFRLCIDGSGVAELRQ